METEFEKLAAAVLALSAGERAALAQMLLASLEDDSEIEAAWVQVAEQRAAELDRGEVEAIPIEEVLAQLRATLK